MRRPVTDSTTPPESNSGGFKRHSRWRGKRPLALLLTAATIVGGAALTVPRFRPETPAASTAPAGTANGSAAAFQTKLDDDKDVSWDMSGGTAAYNKMVADVRKSATERTPEEGSPTLREGILRTNPSNTGLFSIDVTNRNVGQSPTAPVGFRLLMRASDLFILGWLVATPQGAERIYFFQGEDTGYRGQTGRATLVDVPFGGGYTDLERIAGRGRSGLSVNPRAWEAAYIDMIATVAGESDEQTVARAMLMFIPAIAEAARFRPVQESFAPSFQGSNNTTIRPAEAELMLDWSKASKQTINSLNTGAAINFRIDDPATPGVDFEATTIQAMAAILAICLLSQ